jgi:hypothetical protein
MYCFSHVVKLNCGNDQLTYVIAFVNRNMTSGFMIPKSKIPNFWIWLYWVNPTQYTINSLTAIAFYCDVELPSCSTCTLDPTTCPNCNCVRVKDEGNVLAWLIMQSGMSLNYNSRYKNMGALLGLNIVFMVGCVLALRYMKYNRRWRFVFRFKTKCYFGLRCKQTGLIGSYVEFFPSNDQCLPNTF